MTDDLSWQEGMIRNELFHIGRAMIDIGINYKRWSRTDAMAFATANEICDRNSANELVNYCTVNPGSELSYATGCLTLFSFVG